MAEAPAKPPSVSPRSTRTAGRRTDAAFERETSVKEASRPSVSRSPTPTPRHGRRTKSQAEIVETRPSSSQTGRGYRRTEMPRKNRAAVSESQNPLQVRRCPGRRIEAEQRAASKLRQGREAASSSADEPESASHRQRRSPGHLRQARSRSPRQYESSPRKARPPRIIEACGGATKPSDDAPRTSRLPRRHLRKAISTSSSTRSSSGERLQRRPNGTSATTNFLSPCRSCPPCCNMKDIAASNSPTPLSDLRRQGQRRQTRSTATTRQSHPDLPPVPSRHDLQLQIKKRAPRGAAVAF